MSNPPYWITDSESNMDQQVRTGCKSTSGKPSNIVHLVDITSQRKFVIGDVGKYASLVLDTKADGGTGVNHIVGLNCKRANGEIAFLNFVQN